MDNWVMLLKTLRPKQWIKNLFLFGGLVFSKNIFNLQLTIKAILGFILFSLISGVVYIINDIIDLPKDKIHPTKSQRPIPSGRLSVRVAQIEAVILGGVTLVCGYFLSKWFFFWLIIYLLIQVSYSLKLKKIVILDIFIVAIGFVIRVIAGSVVIGVNISSWLIICTLLLALFLALGKRRYEVAVIGTEGIYTPYLLDQMTAVVTSSTIMAYALYTMSPSTVEKFGTNNLVGTVIFVIYGVFRYLYLIHYKKLGGSPEIIVVKDRALSLNIILWIVTTIIIIYG